MGADADVGIGWAFAVLQPGEIDLDRLGSSIAAGGPLPPAMAGSADAEEDKEGDGGEFLFHGWPLWVAGDARRAATRPSVY